MSRLFSSNDAVPRANLCSSATAPTPFLRPACFGAPVTFPTANAEPEKTPAQYGMAMSVTKQTRKIK